jgi:hypothetical protein
MYAYTHALLYPNCPFPWLIATTNEIKSHNIGAADIQIYSMIAAFKCISFKHFKTDASS